MARLAQKQIAELARIQGHLQRALDYLKSADVAVCRRCHAATTTLHYTRADSTVLYEIDKEIGSDLTGADFAMQGLLSFMANNVKQPACQTCNGDGVVMTAPAGAGHTDDLAEYAPCDCRLTGSA